MPPSAFSPAAAFLPLIIVVASLLVCPANAHRVSSVSLISYLDTEGRTYVLDAAMEVVPSEDAALNDQISPEDAAREFASYLVVMFDKSEEKPVIEVSREETSDADTPPELRRQQVLTKLKGTIPEGAKEFLLYLDARCPMAVVMVVVKDEQPSRRMQVILAGEYSRPVSVAPVSEGDPFDSADEKTPSVTKEGAGEDASRENRVQGGFEAGMRAFFQKSMLPSLFVVAVFLLTLGRTSVLWQMGVLLATQAVALALAAWSLVVIPSWSTSVLALATALVALEAIAHRHVRWWRYPLLGVGGLALGFVCARSEAFRDFDALGELGTGQLILFLLGTQISLNVVALVAAALLLFLSRFDWYRKAVVTPLAVVVAGLAIFWTVEVYL